MEECDEQSAVRPGRNEEHVWGSPGKDPTGERVDGRGLTFILQAPGGASKDAGERDILRFCLKSP